MRSSISVVAAAAAVSVIIRAAAAVSVKVRAAVAVKLNKFGQSSESSESINSSELRELS